MALTNHFAFPSLLFASVQVGPSALPRRVATWRANDLFTDYTAHGIYPIPTGRSSSSPTTSSIAATAAPSLPLRKSIAPRAIFIRRQSFHLRTAVRTRFLNARRRRSPHQDLGSHPEQLLVVGHHFAIDFSPPTSRRFRARCARSSLPPSFASGRSFLPAHNSRVHFRIMVRCHRFLLTRSALPIFVRLFA